MIYHILNDEKFSDWVVDSFEKVNPGGNIFLLVSNTAATKTLKDDRVSVLPKRDFLNNIRPMKDDVFVFYFLHLHSIQFLNKYKSYSYKKVWIGYGADYYYYLLREPRFPSLYKESTLKIFNSHYQKFFLKKTLLGIYQTLFLRFRVKRAINQLDYFGPILPNEFDIVKKAFNFPRLKYINFTFGDIEYLAVDPSIRNLGNKILLNNSATFAGNHIDVLKYLRSNGINNKIIIPLSYGNDFYQDQVIEYARVNFGQQVEVLTEFLQKEVYVNKLLECGVVIMGHVRQQAMGNIYGSLFLGAKLFLYKENPVYDFLCKLGVLVFRIDEIENNPEILNVPLTPEQKKSNREVILGYYSKESSLDRVRRLSQL